MYYTEKEIRDALKEAEPHEWTQMINYFKAHEHGLKWHLLYINVANPILTIRFDERYGVSRELMGRILGIRASPQPPSLYEQAVHRYLACKAALAEAEQKLNLARQQLERMSTPDKEEVNARYNIHGPKGRI